MKNNLILISLLILFLAAVPVQDNNNKPIFSESEEYFIPFQIIDSHLYVTVKINNKVTALLSVDNGCPDLHLTESFAKKHAEALGLTFYPDMKSVSYFPGSPNQKCYIAQGNLFFQVKDSIFENQTESLYYSNHDIIKNHCSILSSGDILQFLPAEAAGIIPLKCLVKNNLIRINFRDNRIEFPSRIDSTLKKEYNEYDYKTVNRLQVVQYPITFSDTKGMQKTFSFKTVFDLGFGGNFSFLNTKIVSLAKQFESKNYESSFRFFDEIIAGKDKLKLNYINIVSSNTNMPFDMLVGIKILSNYDIYFDYKNSKIYTKALSKDKFSLSPSSAPGFFTVTKKRDNAYIQCHITAINPATSKFSYKLYDEILAVDNVYLQMLSLDSAKRLLVNRDEIQILLIKRNQDTLLLKRDRE